MNVRKIKEITKDVLRTDLATAGIANDVIDKVMNTKKQNVINALYSRKASSYKSETNNRVVNYVGLTLNADLINDLGADVIDYVKKDEFDMSNKDYNTSLGM